MKKENEKVYCELCKFCPQPITQFMECRQKGKILGNWFSQKVITYLYCAVKNAGNDCQDFEKLEVNQKGEK